MRSHGPASPWHMRRARSTETHLPCRWSRWRVRRRHHAARIAPDLAETHTSLGLVHFWLGWDWPAAETACRKAVALDSSDGVAHRILGIVLSALMRHDEAQAAMRRARELQSP